VYALVAGSGPGIAFGPSAPTVASVARTWKAERLCVDPSGITIVALVPGGTTTVACRDPMSSMETLPRTTCVWLLPLNSSVASPSYGTITTSGIIMTTMRYMHLSPAAKDTAVQALDNRDVALKKQQDAAAPAGNA
jgi:hypothetical protein